MTIRHPEQSPLRKGPDVPNHDMAPAHEKKGGIKTWHKVTAVGAIALAATYGGIRLVSRSSEARPQATSRAAETPSTAPTTAASKAPQTADIPSSILLGDAYKKLSAKEQTDITRLEAEPLERFKLEPRPERIFYGEVFDDTFKGATEKSLAMYAIDGDPNRIIPNVDSEGQKALNDLSFKVDESFRSLEINGSPDNLTTDAKRRESAIKALGSVVFETNETLPYGNPYPAMEAAIQNATSFTPSRGSETNFTGPDIDYRDTGGWLKGGTTDVNGKAFHVGGADANGDDFIVIDNEAYGTPGALQYDFVKEQDTIGKQQSVLVSIMDVNDKFASFQQPDIDPNTGAAVSSGEGAGW